MAAPHVAGTIARFLQDRPAATPSQAASTIASRATADVLTNIGAGSPNLLLHSHMNDLVISGPTRFPSCSTYTWLASASGVGTSFSYLWERSYKTYLGGGGLIWKQIGTGPSYSGEFCPVSQGFHLRVTATDEFGFHRRLTHWISP
jgi:hypothetical protein